MKRAAYIIKSIIICICIGIIIGFFTMVIFWAVSKDKPDASQCIYILRMGAAIGAAAAAFVRSIIAMTESMPVNRALKLAEQEDDCERAYEILEKKIKKARDDEKKNAYMLILSAVYTETDKYDKALETLEKISFNELSQELQQEYFNAFMYTYLLSGDTENAKKVYNDAQPYFAKPAPSVLHTLGVFEYAQGQYGKAMSYLLQSKKADSSDRNVCDCDLYLALCSLKEGKADDARVLADEAEEVLITKSEERDLQKLRLLIEKYEARASAAENEAEAAYEEQEESIKTDNERIVTDD